MTSYNIKDIRTRCKDASFCSSVNDDMVEWMEQKLFDSRSQMDESIDLIASLSNIMLINKEAGLKLSAEVFDKAVSFSAKVLSGISQKDGSFSDEQYKVLLPIYRFLFLHLYYHEKKIDEVGDLLRSLVEEGLEIILDCSFNKSSTNTAKDTITEVLKFLYSYYHKYSTFNESENIREEEAVLSKSIRALNGVVFVQLNLNSSSGSDRLLLKQLLNLIACIFLKENVDVAEVLKEFDVNKMAELILSLLRCNISCGHEYRLSEDSLLMLTTVLILCNGFIRYLKSELNKNSSNDTCAQALKDVTESIIPNEEDNFTYNRLLYLILIYGECFSDNSNLSLQQLNHFSRLKFLILELYLSLTSSEGTSTTKHIGPFLDYFGYELSRDYLGTVGLSLENTESAKFAYPSSKFLDAANIKLKNELIKTKQEFIKPMDPEKQKQSEWDSLSLEEKELEAEKLFTIFDRMEKNRLFEGFKNPIRSFQDEGRFEDIDDVEAD